MGPKELLIETMRIQDEGDREGFMARQAEDCVWRVPGMTLNGRDEVRAWIEPFDRAFPDFHHELTRVVEDEDAAYAEGVFHGTHTGPLPTPQGDVPATGREIAFRFALVVSGNLESGQASSVNVYFDQLEFLGQLGLLPEPAVA